MSAAKLNRWSIAVSFSFPLSVIFNRIVLLLYYDRIFFLEKIKLIINKYKTSER